MAMPGLIGSKHMFGDKLTMICISCMSHTAILTAATDSYHDSVCEPKLDRHKKAVGEGKTEFTNL